MAQSRLRSDTDLFLITAGVATVNHEIFILVQPYDADASILLIGAGRQSLWLYIC